MLFLSMLEILAFHGRGGRAGGIRREKRRCRKKKRRLTHFYLFSSTSSSSPPNRPPLLPLSAPSSSTRTRATLDGGKREGEKGDKNNEGGEEEDSGPEPDAAAFANLVVCAACVTALGALTGVDPWATLFPATDASVTGATTVQQALGYGLAAAPLYVSFLLAARSLVCGGSLWWAEVEGQGALAGLPRLRALAWACAVALADGAAMRGLVLPWLSRLVTAPGGVDVAEVARRAASAPDDVLLKSAADAAAAGLFASPSDALLAAGLGSPVMPFPMPASWLLPVLALAAGAAAAALSCFEPPAGIRAGFRATPEPVVGPAGDRLLDGDGNPRMKMVLGAGIDVYDRPPEGSDAASTMRVRGEKILFVPFPLFFVFVCGGGGVSTSRSEKKKLAHIVLSLSLSFSLSLSLSLSNRNLISLL